jgi:uncharacterized protein (TIGR02246 family)
MSQLTLKNFREEIVRFNNRATDHWNERNLERFCEGYAEDAVYVAEGQFVRGRSNIFALYCRAFPSRISMGKLSLRIQDTRFSTYKTDAVVEMAVAIIRWRVNGTNGNKENGYSMVTYVATEHGLQIVQDVST